MIRKLPEELVRAIAAGEVVTRPEDAVKELVENALDAGAGELEVVLEDGGIRRILVRDDGAGIPKEELPLALERHATSKLSRLDRIESLGFRGEGLFALRQAGRLRLTSRPRDQLGGATVIAEGDRIEYFEHAAPAGTEAELTRLFDRLPARRAALLGPELEGRRALARAARYLLHHPGVRFTLRLDGEVRIRHPGGDFLTAARAVWGGLVADRLFPLEAASGPYRLRGVLSKPELARPRRDRLLLAVNGRPVEWPEPLYRALLRAYRELLPTGQNPVGVLNLELPPERVLVNTDPRKDRVELLEAEAVAEFLAEAVASALAEHPLAAPLPAPEPAAGPAPVAGRLPRLRYLGRFRELYLLAEAEGNLYVVDQHAAHERVIFEELLRRYRDEPPVELSEPLILALAPEEEAAVAERREAFGEAGLELEPFGAGRWRVRRVPGVLALAPEALVDAVRGLLRGEELEAALRRVLGRLACLPAIKAGHPLSGAGAQALLDALAACQVPWVCPHGRPTLLVLSEAELARRFGRRSVRQQVARPSGEVGQGADPSVAEADELAGEEAGVGGVELEEERAAGPEGD